MRTTFLKELFNTALQVAAAKPKSDLSEWKSTSWLLELLGLGFPNTIFSTHTVFRGGFFSLPWLQATATYRGSLHGQGTRAQVHKGRARCVLVRVYAFL